MRKLLLIAGIIGLVCLLFSGCVSRRERLFTQLMQDLENDDIVTTDLSADSPELPDSGLPPEPGGMADNGVNDGTVGGGLTIQPDCLVRIRVKEDPTLDGSYPVNSIGAIEMGRIGPIFLINRTELESEKKVRDVLLGRDFKKATVSVEIVRASYDKVRISGGVHKPGLIRIGAGDTISLNNALIRVGGPTRRSRGVKIRIVRDGLLFAIPDTKASEHYDLVSKNGSPQVPDVALRNNDIAYVYYSPGLSKDSDGVKRIVVLGEVRRPGVYTFPASQPCTIMHLIFKMGGLPLYANKKAIKILRKDKEGVEQEIEVNTREILEKGDPDKDVPLKSGDRAKVPARRLHLF
ncbi:MAG: SLBB domain-containing protein [Kiritimatiellae bacterium]|nr:SLBB domain-containing protein [Kiritimatiellia bacterium]